VAEAPLEGALVMAVEELNAQSVPAVKPNVRRIRLKLIDMSYALSTLEHEDYHVVEALRDSTNHVNKAIDRLGFALTKVSD
jgi:DNA-binding MltR family transcriptional regulator